MSALTSLLEHPLLPLVTAVVVGGGMAALWCWRRASKPAPHNSRVLPWVPSVPGVGTFEMITKFSGTQCPFFLLELARRMRLDTYRIPLPLSWQGAYVVSDARVAREIFTDPRTDKPPHVYKSFQGMTGGRSVMFTQTNTPYMRALRKGTAHAFSKNEIGRMNAIAARHVDTFLRERLVGLVGTGEAFDPCYEMNRITFYVICEAAMEYTPTDDDFESFCEHIEIALKEFTFRQSVNPLRGVLWTLLPGVREALASSKKVMDFTRKVLEAYQSNPHKSPQNTLIKLVNDNPACGDDNHLKTAELLGWITAGHDTTGYTLSNLLVLLAMHPNIQDKLRTAIKGQADPATVDYYKYVVKEASRLVPTAPMGSIRTTGRDFVVDAQTIIPKGAVVFLQQYVGNHSAAIFPSPEAFLPERWENPTLAMNEQMYPFSLGPRNCPGQALAVSEINATLPRLICAYRFELEEAGEMEFFLTLKYRGARIKPIKL